MAITYHAGNVLRGLTTDTKPTNVPSNSLFYEIDNNFSVWYFDAGGNTWIQKVSNDADFFYDDFTGGTYSFAEAGPSPNGKWNNRFRGGGTSGVRVSGNSFAMWLQPQTATASNQTFSCENLAVTQYQDFELTCRLRTISQLRQNSPPNNWETAWLLWRIPDLVGQINYYFVIKISGCEFGKSDNISPSQFNVALATPASPSVIIGTWYAVKIHANGNRHTIWVDTTGTGTQFGNPVIDYVDDDVTLAPAPSRQIQRQGFIAPYCEDSQVEFQNFRLMPLYPKALLDYNDSIHNQVPLPSSNRKFASFYGSGATSADGVLAGILVADGASNAQVIDDLGIHWSYTTDASGSGQSGLHTNVAIFRRSNNLIMRAKVLTPATISNTRFWIGFSDSATLSNSDDPLNNANGYLIGYRNNATTWNIISNNASATDTLTTEGYTLTGGKYVNIQMELRASGECICTIQNRTPITIQTPLPAASANMYLYVRQQATTTTTKTVTIDSIDMDISPGINL